jgi:hypothetical protein
LSQSAAHPAVGRRDRNMTDRLQLRVPPPPALPHLCAIHPLPHSPRDAQLRKKGRHGCDGRGGFGKCTCRPYTRVSRPWCHVHVSLRHPRVGRHQQLPKVGLTPAQPARAPFTKRAKHVHGLLTRTQASAEPPPAGNRRDAHGDLQGRHRGREGEQSPRYEHVNVSVSAQGREATVVKIHWQIRPPPADALRATGGDMDVGGGGGRERERRVALRAIAHGRRR